MPPNYVAGLDLGQAQDFSALAIVEVGGAATEPRFICRHLHRWPLGTRYPDIVADVQGLMVKPPVAGHVRLALDKTGVGAAVADMFTGPRPKARGWSFDGNGCLTGASPPNPPPPVACPITPIMITGGSTVTYEDRTYRVPKRDLVGAVMAPLQTKRLEIAPDLAEAATLLRELRDFKATISAGGHDSYGVGDDWRQGQNDDLVLALAMALWLAQRDLKKAPRLAAPPGIRPFSPSVRE